MTNKEMVDKIKLVAKRKNVKLEGKLGQYFTDDIHDFYEILEKLKDGFKNNHMPIVNTFKLKQSDRYKLFIRDECKCVSCGQKAHFWASQRVEHEDTRKTHLNLYGIRRNGEITLFTKDHIVPRSLGGEDFIDNFQIMCSECNGKKGNDITEEDLTELDVQITFIDSHLNSHSAVKKTKMELSVMALNEKYAEVVSKEYIKKRFKGAKNIEVNIND